MKIFIREEEGVLAASLENLGDSIEVKSIDLPQEAEAILNGFLAVTNALQDDQGVALSLLVNEAFNLGLNWSRNHPK